MPSGQSPHQTPARSNASFAGVKSVRDRRRPRSDDSGPPSFSLELLIQNEANPASEAPPTISPQERAALNAAGAAVLGLSADEMRRRNDLADDRLGALANRTGG